MDKEIHLPRQGDLIDPITGLPRQIKALSDLTTQLRHHSSERTLGVIAMALTPSPALYRQSGDTLHRLRLDISRRVQELLRPQDGLYMLNQREWLIILPNLLSPAALTLAMLRLRDALADQSAALRAPRIVQGSAQAPDDGHDALFLLQSARIARLAAEQDKVDFLAYHPALEENSGNDGELLQELRQALIDHRDIALHLQPQIDLASGHCVGAEALLRWQSANGEWVPPPQILDAIDRLGMRQTFNRWLFLQVAQIQSHLASQGVEIVLSFNLSGNDLLDPALPDLIAQALGTWEVAPERVVLEITETTMVEESWQVMATLNRLRDLGLRLSIDDFGTGYAGMSYLQRLPVNEVKIDQMFVRQLPDSERAREIVTSILQLANRLGLRVIAEGVETEEIKALLEQLGCSHAQGFLFAHALPVDEFAGWWLYR